MTRRRSRRSLGLEIEAWAAEGAVLGGEVARAVALDVVQQLVEERLGAPCVAQFSSDGRTITAGPAIDYDSIEEGL